MTYIKECIITKLQKLYSPPRNLRAGNKSPTLFLKKRSCTGDLSPMHKIFIERPDISLSLMRFIFVISSKWFYYWPILCCSDCCFWRWLILTFDFQLLNINLILIIKIVVFVVRYLKMFLQLRQGAVYFDFSYISCHLVSWWCNCKVLHISFWLQLPSIFCFDKHNHLVLLLVVSDILHVDCSRRLVLVASELFHLVCHHHWLILFSTFPGKLVKMILSIFHKSMVLVSLNFQQNSFLTPALLNMDLFQIA